MNIAERLKQDSFQQGIHAGIEKGMQQGMQQGKSQGEREAKLAVARNMFFRNFKHVFQLTFYLTDTFIEKNLLNFYSNIS